VLDSLARRLVARRPFCRAQPRARRGGAPRASPSRELGALQLATFAGSSDAHGLRSSSSPSHRPSPRGLIWTLTSIAATGMSFLVAVRQPLTSGTGRGFWTLRVQRRSTSAFQGLPLPHGTPSLPTAANLGILSALIALGLNQVTAQASRGSGPRDAAQLVVGNKLWSVRGGSASTYPDSMRRLVCRSFPLRRCCSVRPLGLASGRRRKLNARKARRVSFLATPNGRALAPSLPEEDAYRKRRPTDSLFGNWTIKVWTSIDKVGRGRVPGVSRGLHRDRDDTRHASTGRSGRLDDGPAAIPGLSAGKEINKVWIWLGCLPEVFLVRARHEFRRPLSLTEPRPAGAPRLRSCVSALVTSTRWHVLPRRLPLVYPPLVLSAGAHGSGAAVVNEPSPQCARSGPSGLWRRGGSFLVGFRIRPTSRTRNVIDVGYSGVQSAPSRISAGEAPYGNFPGRGTISRPAVSDRRGWVRFVTGSSRTADCESAQPPRASRTARSAYEAISSLRILPSAWSGRWDKLPARPLRRTLAFDIL
jgi:hypothetical protein